MPASALAAPRPLAHGATIFNNDAMTEVVLDGEDLVVKLSRHEKLLCMHKDVRVPLSAVTSARVVSDGWSQVRGIRAPGTGIPGMVMMGTLRGDFGKDFAVIRGHRPALVVDLHGQEFTRLTLCVGNPEASRKLVSPTL